jgi:DNA polymerase-3 subunit gamma/tau
MLCTTNAEKIPATILSRVQTFQLSKISLEGIYNRLLFIIDNENKEGAGITYEEDAILFIAKMASGGMRDSITLLEKALAYNKHITTESIQEALGLPHYNDYFDLLAAIAKKDNSKIVNIVNSVYNSGVNFTKWFDGFFSFVTNIVKYIYLKDIGQTMIPSTYQDRIKNYTTAHAALCLKLSNTLVELNNALKTSQYQQELAISYLCTPPTKKKQ